MGDKVLTKESGRTVGLVLVIDEVDGSVWPLGLGAEWSTTIGLAATLRSVEVGMLFAVTIGSKMNCACSLMKGVLPCQL